MNYVSRVKHEQVSFTQVRVIVVCMELEIISRI